MKLARPDLAAYVVVALSVLVTGVLAALHVPVPDFVQYVAVTALGIGGGVALQGGTSSSSAAAIAAAPAPARGAAAIAAAPVPLSSEPPTGVFRAVPSHNVAP